MYTYRNSAHQLFFLIHLVNAAIPQVFGAAHPGFKENYKYVYDYRSWMTQGTNTRADSAVNINGDLHIQLVGSLINLKLDNVALQLLDAGENKRRRKRAMRKVQRDMGDINGIPMQFSYTNGNIENMQLSDSYPDWSNNIMRAIASMFVYLGFDGTKNATESDVNGDCPTTYHKCGATYSKRKNLMQCSGRQDPNSRGFDIPKKAKQTCKYHLLDDIIQEVNCTEKRVLYMSDVMPDYTIPESWLRLRNVTRLETNQYGISLYFKRETGKLDTLRPANIQYKFADVIHDSNSTQYFIDAMNYYGSSNMLNDGNSLLEASQYARDCQQANSSCSTLPQYQTLLSALLSVLSSDVELDLRVTEAVGNLLELTNPLIGILSNILGDSSRSDRERMAALDAYRSSPCQEGLQEAAKQVLLGTISSSPLRLKAYFSLIRCLTYEIQPVVDTLVDALTEIDEVGHFILDHLQRGRTANVKEAPLFPSTVYRSKANQPTPLISLLNLEANLIAPLLSSKASTPHCLNSDLTLQALGQTLHPLEIGLCSDLLLGTQNTNVSIRKGSRLLENGNLIFRALGATLSVTDLDLLKKKQTSNDNILAQILDAVTSLLQTNEAKKVNIATPTAKAELVIPTSIGIPIKLTVDGQSELFLNIESQNSGNLTRQTHPSIKISPLANTSVAAKVTLGDGPLEANLHIHDVLSSLSGPTLELTLASTDATELLFDAIRVVPLTSVLL